MLCGSLDERRVWGRMHTCVCMAEYLCCSSETVTTLLIGYTPIQNWRRQWHPTPILLLGKSHGQRSLVGYSPWACKEPDILECEVKWALGSTTAKKASGGDGIPLELFQIIKDDALKVLHSICQQIWKTQQWPQDWKRSVFIPIPKKGNAKECSNYCTIALISCASKVMLKILQARLQQYVNRELPDVQAGFRKGRGTRDQIATSAGSWKKQESYRKTSIFALLTMPKSLCGSQ